MNIKKVNIVINDNDSGNYLEETYNHEITFVTDLLRNPIYKYFFTKVMRND